MNAREQLMRKRIESLEGQIKASIELLGRVLDENEYLASVACAFAWDLALLSEPGTDAKSVYYWQSELWAKAVEEASK